MAGQLAHRLPADGDVDRASGTPAPRRAATADRPRRTPAHRLSPPTPPPAALVVVAAGLVEELKSSPSRRQARVPQLRGDSGHGNRHLRSSEPCRYLGDRETPGHTFDSCSNG